MGGIVYVPNIGADADRRDFVDVRLNECKDVVKVRVLIYAQTVRTVGCGVQCKGTVFRFHAGKITFLGGGIAAGLHERQAAHAHERGCILLREQMIRLFGKIFALLLKRLLPDSVLILLRSGIILILRE